MRVYREISNSELSALIDEWVRGIHAVRNRKILKDRLIDGMLYNDLAEKHCLSVRHVQRIIYKAQEQLFRHIKIEK